MKTINTALTTGMIGLAALSWGASAQTFTGANLNSPPLTYTSETGSVATDVTFHSGTPSYVQLYTPNAGGTIGTDDRPEVSVTGNFGTLSSLNASFNLLSATPALPPDGAYFDIFVQDPGNAANTLELVSYSAASTGVFNLTGSTQMHSLSGLAIPPGFTFGATLSTVEGISDGTTTLGNFIVTSVGVQIGGYGDYSGAMTDDISSLSVDPVGLPDASSTLPLLGIGFGALAGLRRRLSRA